MSKSKKDKGTVNKVDQKKGMSGSQLMIIISIIVIFTAFASAFFNTGNILSLDPINSEPTEVPVIDPEPQPIIKEDEGESCEQYGTYSTNLEDFLEEYITIEGDTFSEISMKHFGTASKATDVKEVNDLYMGYALDDELPSGIVIYLPDEKYEQDGVTAYIVANGNISFNETEPMFGVSAPGSGTGPFNINTEVEQMLLGIEDGDCVVVEYGSRGFDPDKPIFDVYKQ